MDDRPPACDAHAECGVVLACQHVGHARCATVFVIPEDDDYPATAWCDRCERARMADHGWNDAADAVADWRWLCAGCFDDAATAAGEVAVVANPTEMPE